MKKHLSIRISALLLLFCTVMTAMSSCAKKSGGDGSGTSSSSGKKDGYTLGMGIEVTDSSVSGKAEVSLSSAVIIFDSDGKIVDCHIDCAENVMSVKDGKSGTGSYVTKREAGTEYGMKSASGIGKEWYEQAQAFDDWARGKTRSDIEKMSLSQTGSAENADLKAGCTISVSSLQKAVLKAFDDKRARSFSTDSNPEIRFSAITEDTGTVDAKADKDGSAAMYTTFAALAVSGGRICTAIIDTAEPNVPFSADGAVGALEFSGTKRELGDSYGMSGASALGKEWYAQEEFFCDHIKGMTADEVRAVPVGDDGKATEADLSAGCTIAVAGYIKAVDKALSDGES